MMQHDPSQRGPRRMRTLSTLVEYTRCGPAIPRAQISRGDAVIVQTRNSTYRLLAGGDGSFVVQGGWFGRPAAPPTRVEVAGCSFGGSALWENVVAAPGLFLEFRNGVRTTRIKKVWVERSGVRRSLN